METPVLTLGGQAGKFAWACVCARESLFCPSGAYFHYAFVRLCLRKGEFGLSMSKRSANVIQDLYL